MVKMIPLLTIITINRNNAAGLRRTIQSVLPLLGPRVAYLVIDGDSSDESCQVARDLLHQVQEAVLVSEPDSGIYAAMNKGWRMATGEYVAFLNSGDELDLNGYKSFIEEVDRQVGDIFYAKTYLAVESGQILGVHERHPSRFNSDTLPHLATLTRRDLIERLNGFDELFRIVADRDFFIRAKNSGAVFTYFPEVVSIFYLGGVSSGWRSGVESADLSYRYGYIGWFGWMSRRLWYSVTRLHFAMIEAHLPANSVILHLISIVRKFRRR